MAYSMAGQTSELERLRVQARVSSPPARRSVTLIQAWARRPA